MAQTRDLTADCKSFSQGIHDQQLHHHNALRPGANRLRRQQSAKTGSVRGRYQAKFFAMREGIAEKLGCALGTKPATPDASPFCAVYETIWPDRLVEKNAA